MTILSKIKKLLSIPNGSEEALIISEKRYQDFVTSSRDWIWECNQEGVTTYSNLAITNILGFSLDGIIGSSHGNQMHADDYAEMSKIRTECIATKTGWHNKLLRWRSKQGEWHFLESSSVVIFDENGDFAGFRGVDRDVTERIQAEQAHRESLKTLNHAFDATPDGVSITRLSDGKFIYANPALAQMSQFHLDEIIGKTIFELNFYKNPEARNHLIHQSIERRTSGASCN